MNSFFFKKIKLLFHTISGNLSSGRLGVIRSVLMGFLGQGLLDFSDQNIVLQVSAHKELDRLRACTKEPETVDWIKTFVKPGDTFCDIGANVGAYSFIAAHCMEGKGNIYAFEPSFSTFASLCQNIVLNRATIHTDIISPFPIVLYENTGIVHFKYANLDPGYAMHELAEVPGAQGTKKDVFTQPILAYDFDSFIAQFNFVAPTHMKIDVDGAELQVLKGAAKTLQAPSFRSLLIEINEEQNDAKEMLSIIQKAGLTVLSKTPRRHQSTFNYIFTKS